jgi:hypothetical protein
VSRRWFARFSGQNSSHRVAQTSGHECGKIRLLETLILREGEGADFDGGPGVWCVSRGATTGLVQTKNETALNAGPNLRAGA